MAIIIESPNEIYSLENTRNIKLFLAGSISNALNWQSIVIEKLKDIQNLTIYNPRRTEFDVSNKNIMEEQIIWEYNHLKDADIISFWFSNETLAPITLYELGKHSNSTTKKIVIGINPEYLRNDDVIIQTKLARPDIETFHNDLDSFCLAIKNKIENIKLNQNF